jgi:hypothetical protein
VERSDWIGKRAATEAGYDCANRFARKRKSLCVGQQKVAFHRQVFTAPARYFQHFRAEIDRNDARCMRIEPEVLARPDSNFQNCSGNALQQAPAKFPDTEQIGDAFDQIIPSCEAVVFLREFALRKTACHREFGYGVSSVRDVRGTPTDETADDGFAPASRVISISAAQRRARLRFVQEKRRRDAPAPIG